MRQAEKALRDAGWQEAIYADTDHDEEFYLLGTGALLRGNLGILEAGEKVLRAPRQEPEYELGTVARVRVYSGEEFNALMDEYGFWLTVDGSYQLGSAEVLRVIAYPDGSTPWIKPMGNQVDQIKVIDESGYGYVNTSARDVEYAFEDDGKTLEVFTGGTGSTPTDQAEGDRDDLIEGMVPYIAEWGHLQMRTALGLTPEPLAPGWSKASEERKQHWKEGARIALREAYEEATK